jgi:hypothetical protein
VEYALAGRTEVGRPQVTFAPLLFVTARSGWVAPKLLLSILVPAAVVLIYRKAAAKDTALGFAWLSFAIGCAYSYLLAETGSRTFHGNLWWSAQITLLLLFYASLRFCLEREGAFIVEGRSVRYGPAVLVWGAAFLLHLAAGCVWYYAHAAMIYSW